MKLDWTKAERAAEALQAKMDSFTTSLNSDSTQDQLREKFGDLLLTWVDTLTAVTDIQTADDKRAGEASRIADELAKLKEVPDVRGHVANLLDIIDASDGIARYHGDDITPWSDFEPVIQPLRNAVRGTHEQVVIRSEDDPEG